MVSDSPKGHLMAWMCIFFLLAGGGMVMSPAAAQPLAPVRSYTLYQPTIRHVTIHEGKLSPGHYGYNHMASVERFNGRFYAVWGGNASTILEGKPGQVILLSTSEDFVNWTPPVNFVGEGAENPLVDAEGVQWQPNLLNFQDKELWCVWFFHSKNDQLGGTYFSKLGKQSGAKWVNRRIFHRQMLDGRPCVGFASQNPVLLQSGRVLAPVTLYHGSGKGTRRQWNACLYTDDEGTTWQCSNPISRVDDHWAQWEPFFYEQADGRLRAFTRNLTMAIAPCAQWQLTCTGAGAKKGEPVVFDPDPRYSYMETANCRVQVFRVRGPRYCMVRQDAHVDHRDYATRLNLALGFSRTGADDFVAGPPFSRRNVVSAYPQGVEHNGKIYVAYTAGPGTDARSIEGVVIDPAPAPDQFHLWPREKDVVKTELKVDDTGQRRVARVNPDYRPSRPALVEQDARKSILFRRAASAGVEMDPVNFSAGQSLTLRFEAKVLKLQDKGNLVFCSFGDRIPIRLGVPSNRPGKLYAYGYDEWRPVGDLPLGEWRTVTVTFSRGTFSVAIGSDTAKTFQNPIASPNPRLYLGDGYEVDYVPSNWGSEFVIALESFGTKVSQ